MKIRRRSKTNSKNSGRLLIILIVIFICGFVVIKRQNLDQEQVAAGVRLEELEKDLEEEQDVTKSLEEQEEYMKTKEFIEGMARDKFGLVYEDEYMFKSTED